jgi:heme A synthase
LAGFIVHGINGSIVIPALALLLLIFSLFAKVPGGVKWAGAVFALVFVQVMLGYSGPDLPVLGGLHGLNALLLFTTALYTGRRARVRTPAPAGEEPAQVTTSP